MTTKPKHPVIPCQPVKSSQIKAIGHQGTTLAVEFNSGHTYHYHDVSAEQFEALMKAESVGSHLHKHIKPNHPFTRIEETA